MINSLVKKGSALMLVATFCLTAINPITCNLSNATEIVEIYYLPEPVPIDMSIECAMSRRMSIRNFTEEQVTISDLSTILWLSYGYREDHTKTVPGINNTHASHIYVFNDEAVYKYDELNHALVLYKEGDYRDDIKQYEAPIQLGLVWNKSLSSEENHSCAEIGQIGQNIQFAAVALNLGTVVTGERPSPLDDVGLPPDEVGKIVMPLGHLEYPYDFFYQPRWISLLPKIEQSGMNLTEAINERDESTSIDGEVTRKEKSQILWSSYGYSYLLDNSNQAGNPLKRHRTIPSAHGYYPFRIYAVTKNGVYRYIPGLLDYDRFGLPIVAFLFKIRMGDKRDVVADASQQFVKDAPLLVIPVLDIKKTNQWDDLSGEAIRWVWFYEAGASAYNVMLQATALDLEANIVTPTDVAAISDLLRLNNEDFQPMYIVPVGE
jgi:nitroreductase